MFCFIYRYPFGQKCLKVFKQHDLKITNKEKRMHWKWEMSVTQAEISVG